MRMIMGRVTTEVKLVGRPLASWLAGSLESQLALLWHHLPILPCSSHCIVLYFDVLRCISLYFNVLHCICLFIYLHCTVLYCFALNCSWVDNGHDMWHILQTCIIFKRFGIKAGNMVSSPKHFQKIFTLYGNLPQTPFGHLSFQHQ